MELDVMTPPRADDRQAIGGNNPPEPTEREKLEKEARELTAGGSAWLNEIKTISTQQQADRAGAFKRQCHDLLKRADAAKAAEKRPHLDANIEIEGFYKGAVLGVQKAQTLVAEKLTAFLEAEQARKDAEAEAARKVALEAEKAAALAADRAYDAYDAAERGDLAGTGTNTVAALADAEKAQEAAEKAAADADRLEGARAGAGGQYTVGGVKKTVTLRTFRHVVLDLPEKVPQRVMIEALKKLVPYIEKGGKGADLRTEMGRLANAIFKATDEVPPGCKIVETKKAV